MRCTYQIRLTKWNYDKSPRTYEDFCVLVFMSEIPCALQKSDEVDGLPGLDSALVSHCIWSHKNGMLCIRLKDEEYETIEQFSAAAKAMVLAGWVVVTHHKGSLREDRG